MNQEHSYSKAVSYVPRPSSLVLLKGRVKIAFSPKEDPSEVPTSRHQPDLRKTTFLIMGSPQQVRSSDFFVSGTPPPVFLWSTPQDGVEWLGGTELITFLWLSLVGLGTT